MNHLLVIFNGENLHIHQKMIIFALSKQQIIIMEYTENEEELIRLIRNYRSAYPNGAKMLEREIIELVYDLMEGEQE